MHRFTAEGRKLARGICPMTGLRHEPEPTVAELGTFTCKRCGAIPKDSDAYIEDVTHPDAYDPYAERDDDRGLPRLRRRRLQQEDQGDLQDVQGHWEDHR